MGGGAWPFLVRGDQKFFSCLLGSAPATVRRRAGDGTQEDVMYPPCLPDYQAYIEVLTGVTSLLGIIIWAEGLGSGGKGFCITLLKLQL